jgi:hypothetical protein
MMAFILYESLMRTELVLLEAFLLMVTRMLKYSLMLVRTYILCFIITQDMITMIDEGERERSEDGHCWSVDHMNLQLAPHWSSRSSRHSSPVLIVSVN